MEPILTPGSRPDATPDARFQAAVGRLLRHEGGLATDPADPGGITNWGISINYLRRLGAADRRRLAQAGLAIPVQVTADTIRHLTRADAAVIYRTLWWDALGYAALPDPIAAKALDLAVNMGPSPAHKLIQRACRAHGQRIDDDGELGPVSRRAIATVGPVLIHAIRSEAAGYYRQHAAATDFGARFVRGWLIRAYDEEA